ncbi:MAG: Uma2 family endonuclease [Cyclobacteriaceae bacterium]|nr:Uma2 family endonuclease [Cyclobacteriaceae bacterium]
MRTHSEILEELKQSPDLALLIKEANAILNENTAKRIAFYNLIKESDKAEYINGEAVFHSPVKSKHSLVSTNLSYLLTHHLKTNKKGGRICIEKIMIELTRNSYEPDICFFRKEVADTFTDNQMLFPAPDFIVEILSPSTEKTDREIKFRDYGQHGVKEYWIIDPDKETIEQYELKDKQFELLVKLNSGTITAITIDGFSSDLRQIFASN